MPQGRNRAGQNRPHNAPRPHDYTGRRDSRGHTKGRTRTLVPITGSDPNIDKPTQEARRGQTSRISRIFRGVITREPIIRQKNQGVSKSNPPKKVTKGKRSLTTRILRKVGIKKKGQR